MSLDPLLLERLQGLDLAVDRLLGGEGGGGRTSSRRGPGTEFREHRSYTPGDDLRTIDWNAYGRLEEFHVKEHAAEGRLDLALFLDASPSMNYGRFNKLALARELAACLGFVALRRLDQVTVVPLGGVKTTPKTYRGRPNAFDAAAAFSRMRGMDNSDASRPANISGVNASSGSSQPPPAASTAWALEDWWSSVACG